MAYYSGEEIKYNNSSKLKVKNNAEVAAAEDKPAVLSTVTTSDSFSFTFELNSGSTRNISIKNPRPDLTEEICEQAGDNIIDNGSAFTDPPVELLGAKATARQTTVYINNK